MHSSKNIEFRLILDNGERPKLMFDIPSMMCISGKFSRIFDIAVIVSLAFNLSSSIPVDIGRANGSKKAHNLTNPFLWFY